MVEDRTPFQGALLVPVGFASTGNRLRVLGASDMVIRLVPDALSSFERISHCLALFGEFVDFGVRTPPIWAVLGHGLDADRTAYVVTQRVHGVPLGDALRSATALADDAAEDLCVSLARYDAHKFGSGGDYLVDLRLERFVFGHLPGDGNVAAYWIGHDPVYATYDPVTATPVTSAQTHWHVADVVNLTVQGERAVGRRFSRARAELEPLFAHLASSEAGAGRLKLLRQGLEHGELVQGRWWVEQAVEATAAIRPS